jgi:predicted nicotinamide N-methyase
VHRRIAGWPAVLESFAVEDREQPDTARTLEAWTVADLELMIDTDELLRNSSGTEPPYWALVWIGARAIAAQMLDSPPPIETRVLDLGCGLGLSGIAAGLNGAHILFADSVAEALEFAKAGALHHGLTHFETRQLDFTKDSLGETFDLILAADIVYQPDDYTPLVDFLDAHLARPGVLLLSESLRADAKQVVRALEARGLTRTTQAVWIPEQNKLERTWVHRFARPESAN